MSTNIIIHQFFQGVAQVNPPKMNLESIIRLLSYKFNNPRYDEGLLSSTSPKTKEY